MNLLTTTFKFLNLLGGFATVGALLSMAFLVINHNGFLTTSGEKVRRLLKITTTIWVIGAFGPSSLPWHKFWEQRSLML